MQAQYKALQDAGITTIEQLTLENIPTDQFGLITWSIVGRFSKLHNGDNAPRIVAGKGYLGFKTGAIEGVFAAELE